MPAQTGGKKTQVVKRPSAARPRSGTSAAAPADAASGLRIRLIWEELKKVVWPSGEDLMRMTGVVIVTVLIFAAIIGGVDYLLAMGVGRIYNAPTTTSSNNTTPNQPVASPTP